MLRITHDTSKGISNTLLRYQCSTLSKIWLKLLLDEHFYLRAISRPREAKHRCLSTLSSRVIVYLRYQPALVNYDDRLTNCYREGGAQVARCLCCKMHLSFTRSNKSHIQPAIYAASTNLPHLISLTIFTEQELSRYSSRALLTPPPLFPSPWNNHPVSSTVPRCALFLFPIFYLKSCSLRYYRDKGRSLFSLYLQLSQIPG